MKLTYVTTYNAADIHKWSGLGYYMAKMLRNENFELDYIGNLQTELDFILKLKRGLYKNLFGKDFDITRGPIVANRFASKIQSKLKADTELIFSPGSVAFSLLKTTKPKVFYTDATFAGMLDFYHDFSNFGKKSIKYGNYLEQKSLESATLAIYSSEWAAQTAIEHYKVDPAKIKVVPFGANVDTHFDKEEIISMVNNKENNTLHLLFIGVDWFRKGGDRAVKIATELNHRGIKTNLHIVGLDKIPLKNIPDFVINHGFISKSTEQGKKKLTQLFIKSHFLLVPTLAEAYGLVFCEANSFGLPCITTNVGGIPTIIKDDFNGKMFNVFSEPAEWCNYIENYFSNTSKYYELCMTSFDEFQDRLNWKVAGGKIKQLLTEI